MNSKKLLKPDRIIVWPVVPGVPSLISCLNEFKNKWIFGVIGDEVFKVEANT